MDPTRDIFWSNEATKTVIEAWGDRYIELNRGSLKQIHWQQVTDVINLRHGGEFRCTDVQAKNRIDTVKKKYKKEKLSVCESAGKYVSKWPFFDYLDFLLGSPATAIPTCRRTDTLNFPATCEVPVGRRSKRSAPELFSGDEDLARRKFEAMAEVAAKMVEEEEEAEKRVCDGEIGKIAEAIEKFGERYERIEREKMNQMIELEKHKMKLTIDMNVQMMNYFSEFRMKVDRNEQAEIVDNDKESKL